MEKIDFPIIYYQLPFDQILGILVGTEYEIIESDLKSIKSTFTTYLQRQYKKKDEFPDIDLIKPKLKLIDVAVRPAYKSDTGTYPLSNFVKVSIPLVYGQNNQGGFECFVPVLGQSFFYYDDDQLDGLARHFLRSFLDTRPPDELYRLIKRPKPKMDFVSLKVHDREGGEWLFDFEQDFVRLVGQ